jgi:hypothetical protein
MLPPQPEFSFRQAFSSFTQIERSMPVIDGSE